MFEDLFDIVNIDKKNDDTGNELWDTGKNAEVWDTGKNADIWKNEVPSTVWKN